VTRKQVSIKVTPLLSSRARKTMNSPSRKEMDVVLMAKEFSLTMREAEQSLIGYQEDLVEVRVILGEIVMKRN